MYRIMIMIALVIALGANAEGQLIKRYKIGAGLSTAKILGDNPATKHFIPVDTSEAILYGGNFNAVQPGLAFKAVLEPTMDGLHRIPIDVDLTFYTSGERYPVSPNLVLSYWHSITNLAIGTGYQYVFYTLPWANAKLYGGVDVRANMILGSEFTRKDAYRSFPQFDTTIVLNRKPDAYRFGGFLRLGLEGELVKRWSINTSVSLGSLNIIGRDDSRGELLTPLSILESKESIVNMFNLSLMLQYTFNNY